MGKKSLIGALTAPRSARKPMNEEAARSFEQGGTTGEPSRLRRPKPAGERLTVHIPPDLARELRIACAGQRRSMSDAATEALRDWLTRHGRA